MFETIDNQNYSTAISTSGTINKDEVISSSNNSLIKQVRTLKQKKGRMNTGLFLVEGILPIGEAVQAGWNLEAVLFDPHQLTSSFGRKLVDEQSRRGIRVAALTQDLFAALAEKDNPQGILAVIRQRHLTMQYLLDKRFRFSAAIVSPQDPGNVGTILRTLDAVGADGLFLLDGGVELYHPSVVRASMGTIFWKHVVETTFLEFLQWTQREDYYLIGCSAHAKCDYRKMRKTDAATILLLGNEQKGLSSEQMAACNILVSLPMLGRASSLNLAVAAGILLYTLSDKQKLDKSDS